MRQEIISYYYSFCGQRVFPWVQVSQLQLRQASASRDGVFPLQPHSRASPPSAAVVRLGSRADQTQPTPGSSPNLLLLLHIKRTPLMDQQDAFITKKLQEMQCVCCQVSRASSVVLLFRFSQPRGGLTERQL